MSDVTSQLELIKRGAVEVLPEQELIDKLKQGRSLRVKAGFDPTAPDLHVGHTVLIQKMKQFQELGHEVIFLIGDFTGMIGDPSGKSETRKQLTREEVVKNAETYKQQIFKILDPQKTTIEFNHRWMEKLDAVGFIELSAKYTVARMLEREDFKQRYQKQQRSAFMNLCTRWFRAMTRWSSKRTLSWAARINDLICSWVENCNGIWPRAASRPHHALVRRHRWRAQNEQVVGKLHRHQRSAGNIGKIMSISDDLMWRYYELLSDRELQRHTSVRGRSNRRAPPHGGQKVARVELVTRYHGGSAAEAAQQYFEQRFQKKVAPTEIHQRFSAPEPIWICRLIVDVLKFAKSTSEARRLIAQGAVKVDGKVINDVNFQFQHPVHNILEVGKNRIAQADKNS
jgi:tyrosyl-tRNA synthetase